MTLSSSRFLITNCAITSSSDWNVPGLNLRIGRSINLFHLAASRGPSVLQLLRDLW